VATSCSVSTESAPRDGLPAMILATRRAWLRSSGCCGRCAARQHVFVLRLDQPRAREQDAQQAPSQTRRRRTPSPSPRCAGRRSSCRPRCRTARLRRRGAGAPRSGSTARGRCCPASCERGDGRVSCERASERRGGSRRKAENGDAPRHLVRLADRLQAAIVELDGWCACRPDDGDADRAARDDLGAVEEREGRARGRVERRRGADEAGLRARGRRQLARTKEGDARESRRTFAADE